MYRTGTKGIRGIRMRWFSGGFVAGALTGIVVVIAASAMAITNIPRLDQLITGEPDVSVVIGEAYLNREAAKRVNGAYPTDIPGLTLTAVSLDLKSNNRMDLQTNFKLDALFVQLDLQAAVQNQLSVKEGQLAINMVGDPQLGNLNVPLHMLPIDLHRSVTQAVDKVNNDLLMSEINERLRTGFGDSGFVVEGAHTTETALEVYLSEP